ncbi:MAG: hypothetical protein RBJ76_29045 [Stenomitos frigidus ULC029]
MTDVNPTALSSTATVGYVAYASVATEADLRQLIEQSIQPNSFFFLRSLHQVSGIQSILPHQLSPVGQLFNPTVELRWKQRRQGYEVLWLGQRSPADTKTFTAIERQWQTEDHPALLHDRRTPQYPNLFRYPTELKKQMQQRYFRDAETGIVHFVALTIQTPQTLEASPAQL